MATLNECNHIITIGYLKSFVNGLIQNNSDGSTKNVDWSSLPASARTDNYCPTYAQLTGGSLVQVYSAGYSPNKNTDGIIIGGSYTNTQCVKQEDLSLKYTRFKSLTIFAGPVVISQCGGDSTLSYEHLYNVTTKTMTDCTVDTASTTSTVETASTTNNELTWSKGSSSQAGTISYPTFTMPKNSAKNAPSRSTTIKASVSFRGTTNNSNTVTITQNAMGGSYSYYVSERRVATQLVAAATTSQSFDCSGGNFGANAIGYYDLYKKYAWINDCNDVDTSDTAETVSRNLYERLAEKTGSFAAKTCPTVNCAEDKSLSFTWSGFTSSVSFQQRGSNACCMCSGLVLDRDKVSFACANDTPKFITYSNCVGIHDIALSGHDATAITQYFNITLNTGARQIIITPNGTVIPSTYSQTFKLIYGDVTTSSPNRNCEKIITITAEDTTDTFNVGVTRTDMINSSGEIATYKDYDVNINITKK